jgi:hypothetical protein
MERGIQGKCSVALGHDKAVAVGIVCAASEDASV